MPTLPRKQELQEENFANRLSAKQKEFDDCTDRSQRIVTKHNTDNANKIAE